MATTQSSLPVNGNFNPTQTSNYNMTEHNSFSHAANNVSGTTEFNGTGDTSQNSNTDVPKDEVGWYFVEQYYTTLSRTPERLYLYYNRRSQYVAGDETEKITVCVGQKSINERIKSFEFSDAKVRVTNVDSQGSGQNIVIQVIGEMSNKSGPQRRFTQTFVLAEQTGGYFVLNDIFRYLLDEEDDLAGEGGQPGQAAAKGGLAHSDFQMQTELPMLANSEDVSQRESEAAVVDQELQQVNDQGNKIVEPSHLVVDPGEPAVVDHAAHSEDVPAAAPAASSITSPADAIDDVLKEDISQADKPKSPVPTPAASPPKPAASQSGSRAAPPRPAVPKTWANLVAGGNRASTASTTVQPSSSSPQPQSQHKSTEPSSVRPQVNNTPPPPGQDADLPVTPQSSGSEWQTATTRHDHGKKQSRTHSQSIPGGPDNSRAYIKNIGENIDNAALKTLLGQYGELTYVDINRQKNCAFADFSSPAAYQAAVLANPHELNGVVFNVEERRIRPQSFGPGNFGPRGGAMRGGRGALNNGGGNQGRGGFQKDSGRGGLPNRGRGNANTSRGRGGTQQAV